MRARTWVLMMLVAAGAALKARAEEFIRGDANGDGRVTAADAARIGSFVFAEEPVEPGCLDAYDVDDNGRIQLSDAVRALGYLIEDTVTQGNGEPLPPQPSPHPAAGPDPTDDDLDCAGHVPGETVDDPEARLEIPDVTVAAGGRKLFLSVRISSSRELGGYYAVLRDPEGIIEETPPGKTIRPTEFTGVGGSYRTAQSRDGRVKLCFLPSFRGRKGLPPGNDVLAMEVPLCLRPGVAPGAYPLELEYAELIDLETGRSIAAGSAPTITVVEETPAVECLPIERVNVTFALGDGAAAPGKDVSVPFRVRSDRGWRGVHLSIDFDETVIEARGVTPVWAKPDGTDWDMLVYEIDNTDDEPGNAGVDEGYVSVITLVSPAGDPVLPVGDEVELLHLDLSVRAGAPAGATRLSFLDGAPAPPRPSATNEPFPLPNAIDNGGWHVRPQAAESFVFVEGLLEVVVDVTIFRGDANSDGRVNLTDAVHVLENLYLDGPGFRCEDEADANDDGSVDLSDAVAILLELFDGPGRIAPPYPGTGRDPTADGLACGE